MDLAIRKADEIKIKFWGKWAAFDITLEPKRNRMNIAASLIRAKSTLLKEVS